MTPARNRRPVKPAPPPSPALALLCCCVLVFGGCGGVARGSSGRVNDDGMLTTYGCKFSRGLCRPDEVCVDDNLFGSCRDAVTMLAVSKDHRNQRTFVLDSHLRRLLEAVMHDLVRDGYSWRDARTQCVISAVLSAYDDRQATVRTGACDVFGHGSYSRVAVDGTAGAQASIADLVRYVADGYGDRDRLASDRERDYQRQEPIGSAASHDAWQQLQEAAGLPQPFVDRPSSSRIPALSREELEALELFLRLSEAHSSSSEPIADSPLSLSAAAAPSLPPARPRPANARESLVDEIASRQPLPDSAGASTQLTTSRKIDEELVGRLLRDEIDVDELTPEEVLQLTVLIKELLKSAAEPTLLPAEPARAAAPISRMHSSGSTPAASVSRGDDRSISAFVEEGMSFGSSAAGAQVDINSVRTLADQLPSLIEHGPKTAERVPPPAAAAELSANDARLEAELVLAQSASDGDAEKRVDGPAASSLLVSEPYVDVVDPTYGWVKFDGSIDPQKAKSLLLSVAEQLGAGNSSIGELWVKDDEVSFRILPNGHNVTAAEVAKAFVDDRDELVSRVGGVPEIQSAGIGTGESRLSIDEVEPLPEDVPGVASAVSVAAPRSKKLLLAMSLVGGLCVLAIVIAVVSVCVIRKRRSHSSQQGKLASRVLAGSPSYDMGSRDSLLARGEYEDLVRRDRARSKAGRDGSSWRSATAAGGEADGSSSVGGLGREQQTADEYSSQHSGSVSSWGEEPASANMDVTTGHMVLSYMEDHLKDKERLDREWQDLCNYEADPNATDVASLPKNRKKNRHLNVLPYDHNRVVLDETNNVASEDYINANFIVDHDPRSPAYIATQGPLVHTVADFWQMVWEQGCVVIAMLTRLSEGSVAMCHRYWPHDSSELYHIYEVHLVSEHVWSDDYLVRSFYLKNLETNETRTVTQFHFLAWPEGGVPAASKSLLDFRRKVNKSYRGRSRPVIVVCSDGAGRSGSFILLDMVINRMNKGAKEIDIAATLEFLRDQRACMVKTREQFEFVLTSVAEEVQAVLRATPQ